MQRQNGARRFVGRRAALAARNHVQLRLRTAGCWVWTASFRLQSCRLCALCDAAVLTAAKLELFVRYSADLASKYSPEVGQRLLLRASRASGHKDTSLSVKIGSKPTYVVYTSRAKQGITFREPRAASHAIRGEGAAVKAIQCASSSSSGQPQSQRRSTALMYQSRIWPPSRRLI